MDMMNRYLIYYTLIIPKRDVDKYSGFFLRAELRRYFYILGKTKAHHGKTEF